jgi:hypothetical protein
MNLCELCRGRDPFGRPFADLRGVVWVVSPIFCQGCGTYVATLRSSARKPSRDRASADSSARWLPRHLPSPEFDTRCKAFPGKRGAVAALHRARAALDGKRRGPSAHGAGEPARHACTHEDGRFRLLQRPGRNLEDEDRNVSETAAGRAPRALQVPQACRLARRRLRRACASMLLA